MNGNTIQPNTNYNTSFTPSTAPAANQQAAANPQGGPIPPLGNALDLSSNPSARYLQNYNAVAGEPDPFNLPEYQPIKPEELGTAKLANEAMNSKKMNIWLKNAQENEELGDFKDAEKAYKKALKYTDKAEHYKLYAACLKAISASLKDETKASVYKEKAARAFYYLGDLYQKQGALQEAQTAYKASYDLAIYEASLKALVDLTRQLGDSADIATALEQLADFYVEKGEIALAIERLKEVFEVGKATRILEKLEVLYRQVGGEDALEKLADFYAEKGKTTLAIDKLKEVFEVGKSFAILDKIEALYGQIGGEDSQSQLHEIAIQRFELQIQENPKNIGLYRKYAWFLKDIGMRNEARAVKERIDELQGMQGELSQNLQQNFQTLQQKVLKQKTKIGGLKQTIHSQNEEIHALKESVQANAAKNDTAHTALQTRVASFETVKLPEQANSIRTVNTQLENLGRHVKCVEEQVTVLALSLKDIDLEPILSKNPYIKSLNLTRCKLVTDDAFRYIDKWPQLTSLTLTGCKLITDDAFRYIGTCSQLTSLNFSGCNQVTDDAFKYIKKLSQLTSLTFSGCNQVTDEAFEYIGECTQLTSLAFSNCTKVTDDAFRYIRRCTQLTSLAFSNCTQVTDYALLIIKFLGFTQLTSLTLRGCYKITSDAREQLKKQIPGVTIHWF